MEIVMTLKDIVDIYNKNKTLLIFKNIDDLEAKIEIFACCDNTQFLHLIGNKRKEYVIDNFSYGKDQDLNGKKVFSILVNEPKPINYVFERYCYGEWSEDYICEKSGLSPQMLHSILQADEKHNRNVGYAVEIVKIKED